MQDMLGAIAENQWVPMLQSMAFRVSAMLVAPPGVSTPQLSRPGGSSPAHSVTATRTLWSSQTKTSRLSTAPALELCNLNGSGKRRLSARVCCGARVRKWPHRDLASTIHFRNGAESGDRRADVIAARHHPLAGGLRNIHAIASKIHVADALQDRIAVTKYDFKTPS